MSLLPFPETRDMLWDYLPELNRPLFKFYYFLLFAAGAGFMAMFYCRIPVSVAANGIVRPAMERTEIHSTLGGTIEKMFVKEGDTVNKNGLLFELRDATAPTAALANETELTRQQELVDDLQLISSADSFSGNLLRRLKTPLYREQAAAFLSRAEGDKLNWNGARHEADLGRILVKDKVISPKEFYDKQLQENKMQSALTSLQRTQKAAWQAELLEHRQALAVCVNRKAELKSRVEQLDVRAPVPGIVTGLRSWYPGCSVRPEQPLCTVSPEGDLIGECFIPAREAGLLLPGQPLRISIDAFNANYFGRLSGCIGSVSNDITFIDNKPFFTVRCIFLRMEPQSKRGYRGLLKKGYSFQVRCVVAERTIFQLLYDNLEDWINPRTLTSYSA